MGIDPPLVGVAVNVTLVPSQTGFSDDVTDTLTGRLLLTVIVTAFEVAGLPIAQVALEVRMQVMMLLFEGA